MASKYTLGEQVGICKLRLRTGNTNCRPGPVNINFGPGPVNANWGPGPVNTNWGLGLGTGAVGQGQGWEPSREPENTKPVWLNFNFVYNFVHKVFQQSFNTDCSNISRKRWSVLRRTKWSRCWSMGNTAIQGPPPKTSLRLFCSVNHF